MRNLHFEFRVKAEAIIHVWMSLERELKRSIASVSF